MFKAHAIATAIILLLTLHVMTFAFIAVAPAFITLAPLVSTTLPPMGQWQTDRDRALNEPAERR